MYHRIKAVVLRELFSSAASPTAWIFLIIFLVLAGFCSFVAGNCLCGELSGWAPF